MKVVCPSCHVANNLPYDKLEDQPKCGRCKKALFLGSRRSFDDENFGKNWQPATESAAKPKPKVEDDNIKTGPSDSDLAAMGTTVASEDDAPF